MNIKKIAIIGNLANVGFTMTKYMSELDVICNLIVTESQYSLLKKQNPDVDLSQCSFIRIIKDSGILKKYTVKLDIVKVLNEYDIIISVGLGGFWSLPLVSKPYVAYATGSDLRELAMGGKEYPRINKIVSRYLFKKAKMIFYSPDQGHLDAIKKLQLKNTIPWRQFVDIDFWNMDEVRVNPEQIRIFHPTALQWTGKFTGMLGKGNDILFKGFKIFLDKGGKGILFYLQRGLNLPETEKLIDELGIKQFCIPHGTTLNKIELRSTMHTMDVIVDQFHLGGGYGLIILESIALGKPAIAGVFDSMYQMAYKETKEPMPFVQAFTPEQVATQLLRLQSYSVRKKISLEGREWIEKYHAPRKLACWYLEMIQNAPSLLK